MSPLSMPTRKPEHFIVVTHPICTVRRKTEKHGVVVETYECDTCRQTFKSKGGWEQHRQRRFVVAV